MTYVCQLRDGYMLVEEAGGTFKIEKTGYPYMDTKKPSQDMLDSYLKYFNIYNESKIKTIQELADVLEPIFDFERSIPADELKDILISGKLPAEDDGFLVKVFDCSYFAIYVADGFRTVKTLQFLKEKGYYFEDDFGYNHACILHSHTRDNEILFKDASCTTDISFIPFFIEQLEQTIGLSMSDFKLMLDTIHDKIDETGFYFMCNALPVCTIPVARGFWSSYSLECSTIARWVQEWLNPWKEYCRHSSMDTSVKRALEGLTGCNLFNRVTYKYSAQETFSLGLLLCYYDIADESEKKRLKKPIKNLIATKLESFMSVPEMYYGVQDDSIILLMSPYFKYAELKGTFLIYLDKFKDKHVIKMPNGEDMCAISLDLRNNYSFLSDIENRWIQYFTICYCHFIIGCSPKYCDLKSVSWYKTEQPSDVQFTLRDSIKALQPNFDRLFMFDAYNSSSIESIAVNVYNYASFRGNLFVSSYIPALEFAMTGQSEFTFNEKAFLLGFTLIVDFERDGSLTDFWFRIYNKRSDKMLEPALSDDFIEKLKVIFKAYLIVFKLNIPMEQLSCMSFSFSYMDYTLECKIERR